MNYWIFQSVPSRYDLREEANLHQGMDGWWYATRYRKKMRPGDVVFFWMGGDKDIRGIYGVGSISSTPYEEDNGYKVKVKVDKRLSHHIPVGNIKSNKKLENLMILKIAVGSNFLINQAEGLALSELIDGDTKNE